MTMQPKQTSFVLEGHDTSKPNSQVRVSLQWGKLVLSRITRNMGDVEHALPIEQVAVLRALGRAKVQEQIVRAVPDVAVAIYAAADALAQQIKNNVAEYRKEELPITMDEVESPIPRYARLNKLAAKQGTLAQPSPTPSA